MAKVNSGVLPYFSVSLDNARVNQGVEKYWSCGNGVGYKGSEADIRRLANPSD